MSFFETLQEQTEHERQILLGQPVIARALAGNIELETYLAFLHQAYHHVKHTVPLLMACGSRLPERLEWLREALAEYIEEELGHQQWILNDIEAAGGDRAATINGEPSLATELMVSYAYHRIDRGDPIGFFGMVHVLEGTSIALADRAAAGIKGHLGLPETAFSYLISHGSLDVQHVDFFKGLVDRLEQPSDMQAVIAAARRFYLLYAAIFENLSLSSGRSAA
ncbi:MAG: iron-containing redox enzyme family protein [Wenzhouxiangellaceae bacterium]|nr:iron-containing redox enzyme family protein [Wenzhouxiangellaceae bacterium]